MNITCPCDHCHQNLEFEPQDDGLTVACPSCGEQTTLISPARKKEEQKRQRLTKQRETAEQAQAYFNRQRDLEATQEAAKTALLNCYVCQGTRSGSATVCPHCGHPFENSVGWGNIFGVVFKVMVAALVWSVPLGILLAVLRFIFSQ